MRRGLAHCVVFIAVCVLAGKTHVRAQSAPCPPHLASASQVKQRSGPAISIIDVTFSDALQLPLVDQERIAAWIKQRTRGEPLEQVTDDAVERVKAGWQNHGYFKVQVGGEERTLTDGPAGQRIALSFRVEEGLQYSLGEITFRNNKAIDDTSTLGEFFPISDGDIFSREKIAEGLENLKKAYGEMGYINFTAVPDTKFDDEKKMIALDIDLDEGKQFYVSSVDVLGLDEPARQELLKELPIKRGQIYSSRVWELLLLKYRDMLPECGCQQELSLDEHAGTVAVAIDFRPCSTD
jgi:outer membrane translocation and assembly module TamA